MNYQPIWKLERCRITETYEVEGRIYEAELDPSNPGFCAGMAGFGTYCISVVLQEKGQETPALTLFFEFPKGNNPHQLMEPSHEKVSTLGSSQVVAGPRERISPFAQEAIGKAVRFYLKGNGPSACEGMKLLKYSIQVE